VSFYLHEVHGFAQAVVLGGELLLAQPPALVAVKPVEFLLHEVRDLLDSLGLPRPLALGAVGVVPRRPLNNEFRHFFKGRLTVAVGVEFRLVKPVNTELDLGIVSHDRARPASRPRAISVVEH
jgi:hypothetical protein